MEQSKKKRKKRSYSAKKAYGFKVSGQTVPETTNTEAVEAKQKSNSNATTAEAEDDYVFESRKFVSDTMSRWCKDLLELPVYKDIARLCKNIRILDFRTDTILYQEDGLKDRGDIVYDILVVLAKELDGDSVLKIIEDNYYNYVTPGNGEVDTAEQLKAFFSNVKLPADCGTVRIIKCIQQEMISPGVKALRERIYSKFPYKDIKGTWEIYIEILATCVILVHTKWEQSHDSSNESYFKFQWELRLVFGRPFEATINIIDYEFHPGVPVEKQVRIKKLMSPFLPQKVEYTRVWKKAISEFNIHMDLPRLGQNLVIYSETGLSLIHI
eukprot:TRINITY_DN647_c0_g1_i3.p1 TRINITY_DN647_c0_g1~~TRINITY_DN647_c0_g1_i3.p1  ORF type:complete len:326 (+),score=37.31 TRINITY_DN647_c0_g1_i3:37-1014(+)